MTKAIFFDVDGTLVSFKTHQISPAVRQALQALRERGILVRWWSDPPIENWLRVTIGTDEEMEEFARGMREIVS